MGVLEREPANAEAVVLAGRAAAESGDAERAAGYERLAAALGAGREHDQDAPAFPSARATPEHPPETEPEAR